MGLPNSVFLDSIDKKHIWKRYGRLNWPDRGEDESVYHLFDPDHPRLDAIVDYGINVMDTSSAARLQWSMKKFIEHGSFREETYEEASARTLFSENIAEAGTINPDVIDKLLEIGQKQKTWIVYGYPPINIFVLYNIAKSKNLISDENLTRKSFQKVVKKINNKTLEESRACELPVHINATKRWYQDDDIIWNLLTKEEEAMMLASKFGNCVFYYHWFNRQNFPNDRIYWGKSKSDNKYYLARFEDNDPQPAEWSESLGYGTSKEGEESWEDPDYEGNSPTDPYTMIHNSARQRAVDLGRFLEAKRWASNNSEKMISLGRYLSEEGHCKEAFYIDFIIKTS